MCKRGANLEPRFAVARAQLRRVELINVEQPSRNLSYRHKVYCRSRDLDGFANESVNARAADVHYVVSCCGTKRAELDVEPIAAEAGITRTRTTRPRMTPWARCCDG